MRSWYMYCMERCLKDNKRISRSSPPLSNIMCSLSPLPRAPHSSFFICGIPRLLCTTGTLCACWERVRVLQYRSRPQISNYACAGKLLYIVLLVAAACVNQPFYLWASARDDDGYGSLLQRNKLFDALSAWFVSCPSPRCHPV